MVQHVVSWRPPHGRQRIKPVPILAPRFTTATSLSCTETGARCNPRPPPGVQEEHRVELDPGPPPSCESCNFVPLCDFFRRAINHLTSLSPPPSLSLVRLFRRPPCCSTRVTMTFTSDRTAATKSSPSQQRGACDDPRFGVFSLFEFFLVRVCRSRFLHVAKKKTSKTMAQIVKFPVQQHCSRRPYFERHRQWHVWRTSAQLFARLSSPRVLTAATCRGYVM